MNGKIVVKQNSNVAKAHLQSILKRYWPYILHVSLKLKQTSWTRIFVKLSEL